MDRNLLGLLIVGATLAAAPTQLIAAPAFGETNNRATANVEPAAQGLSTLPEVQAIVSSIVLEAIPHTYENTKDWGKTAKRWDGLHIARDGWRIKTKRRKKEVNHGTWSRYRVDLIDPDEEFEFHVENVRQAEDGRIAFDAHCTAQLHCHGRTAQWVRGVQLFSVSADADATVQLRLSCLVAVFPAGSKLLPAIQLRPEVTAAEIDLQRFRLHSVSNIGSDVAEPLGRALRGVVEGEIRDQRDKLPGKLNRQIAKKQDRLRLSLADLVKSKWKDLSKFVPDFADDNPPRDEP